MTGTWLPQQCAFYLTKNYLPSAILEFSGWLRIASGKYQNTFLLQNVKA